MGVRVGEGAGTGASPPCSSAPGEYADGAFSGSCRASSRKKATCRTCAIRSRAAPCHRAPMRGGPTHRELKSDLLLVKPEKADRWIQFRDVFEVDGKPIARSQRAADEAVRRADRRPRPIRPNRSSTESARYNIGNVVAHHQRAGARAADSRSEESATDSSSRAATRADRPSRWAVIWRYSTAPG